MLVEAAERPRRRSASWTTPNRNTLTTHSVVFYVLYGTLFAIASSSASSKMGCPKRSLFSASESWKSSASSRTGVKSGSLPPRSLSCFDEHACCSNWTGTYLVIPPSWWNVVYWTRAVGPTFLVGMSATLLVCRIYNCDLCILCSLLLAL